jgi:hypothetical protein
LAQHHQRIADFEFGVHHSVFVVAVAQGFSPAEGDRHEFEFGVGVSDYQVRSNGAVGFESVCREGILSLRRGFFELLLGPKARGV